MESQGGPLLRAGVQRHALLYFGLGRMSLSSVLTLTPWVKLSHYVTLPRASHLGPLPAAKC